MPVLPLDGTDTGRLQAGRMTFAVGAMPLPCFVGHIDTRQRRRISPPPGRAPGISLLTVQFDTYGGVRSVEITVVGFICVDATIHCSEEKIVAIAALL